MSSGAVFLHIGLPKTGTTHLQNLLWHNRRRLSEAGVLYPGQSQRAHWAAAMDLQGSQLPGVPGALPGLLDEVGRFPGRVVISHELFAWATADQVAEVMEGLGARDVHVVVTLRDFSRIVPASWQERAKNRQVEPWVEFLEQVGQGPAGGHRFWRLQDAPSILQRWAKEVPAERMHVVTIPPLGGDRDLLQRRFASVVGFDATTVEDPPPKANESIGAVEVAVLQSVNRSAKGRLDWGAYRALVKNFVVPQMLASRPDQMRVVLPESSRSWVEAETRRTVEAVRSLGCDVVGDLDELAPVAFGAGDDGRSTAHPERVSPDDVQRASTDLVVDLLHEIERLRAIVERGRSGRATALLARWRRARRRRHHPGAERL
jgi:hypothetical protein